MIWKYAHEKKNSVQFKNGFFLATMSFFLIIYVKALHSIFFFAVLFHCLFIVRKIVHKENHFLCNFLQWKKLNSHVYYRLFDSKKIIPNERITLHSVNSSGKNVLIIFFSNEIHRFFLLNKINIFHNISEEKKTETRTKQKLNWSQWMPPREWAALHIVADWVSAKLTLPLYWYETRRDATRSYVYVLFASACIWTYSCASLYVSVWVFVVSPYSKNNANMNGRELERGESQIMANELIAKSSPSLIRTEAI